VADEARVVVVAGGAIRDRHLLDTSMYSSENSALWLHEVASGVKRLLISRTTASMHCGLPELHMFGSFGSYCGDRLGRRVDQS